jgi:excinuclease ABC subunit C
MFLEGKNEALLETLKKQMEEASERLAFETAAKVRDQIAHIEKVLEKQKIVSRDFIDQDVIGLHRQDHTVVIHPLFIRAGKLLGGKGFAFPSTRIPEEEVLDSFLRQYYRQGKFIPDQVLIPMRMMDQTLLEEWLAELKGKRVRILVPERGEKKHLLGMACENAEKFLTTGVEIEKGRRQLLNALKEELHLARIPSRIEAFDISNIQGRYAVGSMVVFEHGEAVNERYRHFRIRSIEGADDYGMMYEVLLRRYKKALEEDELPDLVLVDGGRGQLNVAQEALKELDIRGVDLIGLAKERRAKRSRLKGEI